MQAPQTILPDESPYPNPKQYIQAKIDPHDNLTTHIVELDDEDRQDIIYYRAKSAVIPDSPSTYYLSTSLPWHELVEDHDLYPGRPRANLNVDVRDNITAYKRHRGKILHTLIESFDGGETLDEADDEIEDQLDSIIKNQPDDTSPRDLHTILEDWPGSPRIHDEPILGAEYEIRDAALEEAREMEMCWIRSIKRNPHTRVVAHEHQYVHKPEEVKRERAYGGRVDVIILVKEGHETLEHGLYAVDVKTSEEINHQHRMQVEAHRRWLCSTLGVEAGGLLMLVDSDGVTLETHLDDSWPADDLWTHFLTRLNHVFSDTLFDIRTMYPDR
ncbi:hypothetical protein GRS48_12685 [Halorubrum sp. JWXQ-INN 858]|uniref:hypothetical protein n=1 Tax=Halorubrum sp. JWXQ-INN 858 TaxID=2690782 RepID=UPI0013597295|nr:hypothetical protein [Halorubrum sp. JWXQ-INN 858]MWV65669.1 hypothetical protein [Halorubrum sp. JWXQ-INN 858]